MVFDLTNEEKSQQAFQARLKVLKAALKADSSVKAKENAVLAANVNNHSSHVATNITVSTGTVNEVEAAGSLDSKAKFFEASSHTQCKDKASEGIPFSKINTIKQSEARQAEGDYVTVSRATLDLIIRLANDVRLKLKHSTEERQMRLSHDSVMNSLQELQTKCDTILKTVQEIQECVSTTKVAYSQIIDVQKSGITASGVTFANLASSLDDILGQLQNSQLVTSGQTVNGNSIPHNRNPTVDNASAKLDHIVNGGGNEQKIPAILAAASPQNKKSELNLDGKQTPTRSLSVLIKYREKHPPREAEQFTSRVRTEGYFQYHLGRAGSESAIHQRRKHL
jgi:hypothetical protein